MTDQAKEDKLGPDGRPDGPPMAEGGQGPTVGEAEREREHPSGEGKGKKEKKKGKKKKKGGSARGVETLFRTNYRTHLDLSALADNKANIMISINGIIISILLASIYPRILENRYLLVPTAVLLVFCLLSLVYAVLAARPRVTEGQATLEQVKAGKANILFFGTFSSMSEEEYVEGMRDFIREPERTYESMARDIYGLGSVLTTKYRLLRLSYTLFMMGLIAGVLLFLVVFGVGAAEPAAF